MDYEKEYKSLVAKIKNAHLYAQTDSTKNVLEDILPILTEYEDDRIRKCIRVALTDVDEQRFKDFDTTLADCLAYLEKPKDSFGYALGREEGMEAGVGYVLNHLELYGLCKSAEWTEEDSRMLDSIIKRYSFPIESDLAVFVGEEKLAEMKKELAWLISRRGCYEKTNQL